MASPAEAQRRLAVLDDIATLKAEKRAILARADQTRFSGYRDKPVEFVEEVLGDQLWSRQRDILFALQEHRRVVVSSSFATGKTWTAARIVTWWCATHPSAIAITTASVGRQVSGQLWGEIRKLWRRGVRLPGTMTPDPSGSLPGGLLPKAPEWTITPGENFALGFSTNDPNRFAGWHGGRVLIVLDEAEGIPEDMWDIMEGQLSTGDTAVLALGNPDPEGLVGGFQRAASSSLWHHITISAFDTPNLVGGRDDIAPYLVTGRWVAERRVEWGEDHPLWITKVLGQFVEGSAAKHVVPLAWFERAIDRPGPANLDGDAIGGLDIARFGADSSALVIRRGSVVVHMEKIHGFAGDQVGGWAIDRLKAHGCTNLNGDSGGLGGPVLDFIRSSGSGIHVRDINAGSAANDKEEFVRRRDELWWAARERFETDCIVLSTKRLGKATVDQLKAQMVQVRYTYRPDGRKVVESKDEMAKRGMPSPDLADALNLSLVGPSVVRTNLSKMRGRQI
jgi:phage terminase large subunit